MSWIQIQALQPTSLCNSIYASVSSPANWAMRGRPSESAIEINEIIHVTGLAQCLAHSKCIIKVAEIAFAMGLGMKGEGISLVGVEGRTLEREVWRPTSS